MRNTMKTLAMIILVVFLSNHLAYANSFTDWFTTRKPGGSAAYFFQKSIYKDHIYNPVYTKAILPAGRTVELYAAPERVADKALKNGDWDMAIRAVNIYFKEYRTIGKFTEVFLGPLNTGEQWASTFETRGQAYVEKGDYDQAISDFSAAIEHSDKRVNGYSFRGLAYYQKGELDQAISDWSTAISRGAQNAYVYTARGAAYSNKGNYSLSILDQTEAIKIDPNCALAYNNRGYAYYMIGNTTQAVSDWNEAIKVDPKNKYAHNALKEVLNGNGN